MSNDNFRRLVQLADEVFAVKNDPDQLDVNPRVMKRLKKIHPATISEYNDGKGPVAWVLVIPTTAELMQRFLAEDITEKELFYLTPTGASYEALYLCSGLVLEEYRRKGILTKLTREAIDKISRDHPLQSIFVWPFSEEGNRAAEKIARMTSLPLYKRVGK